MRYEQEILRILTEAGPAGVSVRKLTLNVYNMSTSFFDAPDLEAVHRHVQHFLAKNSTSRSSLVERMGERGCYRLNTSHSPQARQLMLEFGMDASTQEEETPKPIEEQQPLSLFDTAWMPAPAKPHDPNQSLDLFD